MGNKSIFTMYEIHVPLSFWSLQIEDLGHMQLSPTLLFLPFELYKVVASDILVDLQRSRLYLLPVLFHVLGETN